MLDPYLLLLSIRVALNPTPYTLKLDTDIDIRVVLDVYTCRYGVPMPGPGSLPTRSLSGPRSSGNR